jgi:hypothetical protein
MFEKNSDADSAAQSETLIETADSESTFVSQGKAMFDEHKGKLAIGVAATLGVMIFYNWRERQLAKHDPEGHARLQRLKAIVRANDGSHLLHTENETNCENEEMIASQGRVLENARENATAH